MRLEVAEEALRALQEKLLRLRQQQDLLAAEAERCEREVVKLEGVLEFVEKHKEERKDVEPNQVSAAGPEPGGALGEPEAGEGKRPGND